jgi:hypothetical protein
LEAAAGLDGRLNLTQFEIAKGRNDCRGHHKHEKHPFRHLTFPLVRHV